MDPNLLTEWKTSVSPCYDFIGQKMGYRFVVQDAHYTAGPVHAGDSVTLQVTLENVGFAPMYNERHAITVLVDPNGNAIPLTMVTSQNDDLRTWLPGETLVVSQTLTLPRDLPAGNYTYAVAMPDASGNPLYAVQFASQVIDNPQTFDAQRGLNSLFVSLRVQ
jgi:hypothetical protein